MDNGDDCETCWICLEGVEGSECKPGLLHANRLIRPCRCPRVVHSVCLAKWQLSQSGKSEEKFCRFCKDRLPDWQENLALPGMAAVEPVMSVHFNGQTHMVKVKPGEEGRLAFIQDVRRLLRLRDNQEFSITFECKVPGHGMFLDLKGLSSYDAAVFCAAMTAVERQRLAAQKALKTLVPGINPATSSSSSPAPSASIPASARSNTHTTNTNSTSSSSSSSSNNNSPLARHPAPTGEPTAASHALPGGSPTSRAAAGSQLSPSRRLSNAGSDAGASSSDTDAHNPATSLVATDSEAGSGRSATSRRGRSLGPRGLGLALVGAGSTRRAGGHSDNGSAFGRGRGQSAADGAVPAVMGADHPPLSPSSPVSARPSTSGGSGMATGRGGATGMVPRRREVRSHGACEIAAPAEGGEGAAAATVADGLGSFSSPSASAGSADRRKAHWHGWHYGLTLCSGHAGTGAAAAVATAVTSTAAATGAARQAGEAGGAASPWFSRLLMCGRFGAVGVPEPSQ